MSLFKTLQNSPATISIFHNTKVPESEKLYQVLNDAYRKLNGKKNKFQVDLMANQMPTYDQYVLLLNGFVKDSTSKEVLKKSYPLFNDRTEEQSGTNVILRGVKPSSGLKVFNEGEYSMIHEAFTESMEQEKSDVKPECIFHAPLIVDWDHNLVANDFTGLNRILENYDN